MKVTFTIEEKVVVEKQIDIELHKGFTINNNDNNFIPLLKHINGNFKPVGMTTVYKEWVDTYSYNQGGNNGCDLTKLEVLHVSITHDAIALKIFWKDDSDFAIVILEPK